MEKVFATDAMAKRERVLATLNHQPVDRAALLEQLSHNPRVIADWTGKTVHGFDYTLEDICAVIRQTCDLVMPPVAPRGTALPRVRACRHRKTKGRTRRRRNPKT